MSANPTEFARGDALIFDLDFWIALILLGGGGYALYTASGFDAVSGTFPMVVSGGLGVCGLILLVRCLRKGSLRRIHRYDIGVTSLFILLVGGWAVALGAGVGFAISTFLMQCGMLWFAGHRQIGKLALLSALVTVTSYMFFVVALGVRLPRSFLSFIAPGL